MNNIQRAAVLLDLPSETLKNFVEKIRTIELTNTIKTAGKVNVDQLLESLVLEYDQKL